MNNQLHAVRYSNVIYFSFSIALNASVLIPVVERDKKTNINAVLIPLDTGQYVFSYNLFEFLR